VLKKGEVGTDVQSQHRSQCVEEGRGRAHMFRVSRGLSVLKKGEVGTDVQSQ
ncbi:hypothetical protein NDU88_000083, partial [Pleurodeles waltl]